MPSRWAKTGTRASSCTRSTSVLPPRGTITSIVPSRPRSISPTAARSVVGTSWIASARQARGAQALDEAGVDRARRAHAVRAAAEDHRVARLEAERAGIGGDVGPALEDDADDAERRAHARNLQAVGHGPFGDRRADRIGQGGDGAERRRSMPSMRLSVSSSRSRKAWLRCRGLSRLPCRPRWPRGSRCARRCIASAAPVSAASLASVLAKASTDAAARALRPMLAHHAADVDGFHGAHAVVASAPIKHDHVVAVDEFAARASARASRRCAMLCLPLTSSASSLSRPARPRAISRPSGSRIDTASPRAKSPVTLVTPIGSRLLPSSSARPRRHRHAPRRRRRASP